MNIKINGDVVTVISGLDWNALKKCAPIFVEDTNGKKVYGVDVAPCSGSITKVGAAFTYGNAEGKACVNFIVDNCPEDAVATREQLAIDMAEELGNLAKFEEAIAEAIVAKEMAREELMNLIEVG